MLRSIHINERRSDREMRDAVRHAINLNRSGDLMESLRLLLEKDVPTPLLVRTLLNNEHLAIKSG